jgi:hypothetical protein
MMFVNSKTRDFGWFLTSFVCNQICSPMTRREYEKKHYDASAGAVVKTGWPRSGRASEPGHSLIM